MQLGKKKSEIMCIELFDEIPVRGNAIVVIGDLKNCEPCKELHGFLKSQKDNIDATVVDIDHEDFSACKPNANGVSMPTILFIKDANVVGAQSGFGGGGKFIETMKLKFGLNSYKK